MRVLLLCLLVLTTSLGLKLNVPVTRRSALSALVLAPTAVLAADNAGTYGYSGGYEAMPSSTPAATSSTPAAPASAAPTGSAASSSSLSGLLDSVPVDLKGEEGVAKDAEGVARIKAKDTSEVATALCLPPLTSAEYSTADVCMWGAQSQVTPLTAAEKQAAKQAAFKAKKDAETGFEFSLPSLPKLF